MDIKKLRQTEKLVNKIQKVESHLDDLKFYENINRRIVTIKVENPGQFDDTLELDNKLGNRIFRLIKDEIEKELKNLKSEFEKL